VSAADSQRLLCEDGAVGCSLVVDAESIAGPTGTFHAKSVQPFLLGRKRRVRRQRIGLHVLVRWGRGRLFRVQILVQICIASHCVTSFKMDGIGRVPRCPRTSIATI
jgi:hypothetical protein